MEALIALAFLVVTAGTVPVICYHEFGGPPEFSGGPQFDVHGLNIPISAFRQQLEVMEKQGYYPVNMRDLIRGKLSIPKGRRPIVLTFDDGRPTQFRYLENGSIDPNCAVGVMVDFHHHHPDWPTRGTFYIIAGSDENGVPFDQEDLERQKLKQLLDWGFELGNHTLTHPSFKKLTRRQLLHEISGGDAYLKRLFPSLKVDTLALPYGDLPENLNDRNVLVKGRSVGHAYQNIGVLLVGGGLSHLPGEKGFDPFRIPRVLPIPGAVEKLLTSAGP